MNTYLGGVYQQAVSGVTLVDQDCYQLATGCFSVYAVEYEPGFDDAVSLFTPDIAPPDQRSCRRYHH